MWGEGAGLVVPGDDVAGIALTLIARESIDQAAGQCGFPGLMSHPCWVMLLIGFLVRLSLPEESQPRSQVPGDRPGAKEKKCLLPPPPLIRS
jgi:hypothetical protein